jgi:hypothetical protein
MCLAAGMDDYVAKPTDAEQLRAVIDRVCAASGGGLDAGCTGCRAGELTAADFHPSTGVGLWSLVCLKVRPADAPCRRHVVFESYNCDWPVHTGVPAENPIRTPGLILR